ncbi:MAG: hypothetical protein HY814_03330 [Candidatus Riflebacteria bacterium]|nr:hypothetical protein [Candidatus Riflebacteria bacterium]
MLENRVRLGLVLPFLALGLLATPERALSDVVRLELGAGPNLVSLPEAAYSTSAYTAAALAADTGAVLVTQVDFRPGERPHVFGAGLRSPDFQFSRGRPVLVVTRRTGSALLRVPAAAPASLPEMSLQLRRGLSAVAVPVLAGAPSYLSAADLLTLSGAQLAIRTRIEPATRRSVFEVFIPAPGQSGFRLEPGHGYILSAVRTPETTVFPLYRDVDDDGLPDDVQAVKGLSGGAPGDTDGDGLSNLAELHIGTDPGRSDTDGDGTSDELELANYRDPGDPAPSFAREAYPIFLNRCVPCHESSGNSAFPDDGWAATTAEVSYRNIGQVPVLDRAQPDRSLLLLKPLGLVNGGVAMGGGTMVIFTSGTADPDYQTLLNWIRAGALFN